MINEMKIAFRNLKRQKRRTVLTVTILSFGVVAVLIFSALAGSFKNMMIGQITDSMMGHLQIHKKGYIMSLDNLPLDKMMEVKKIEELTKTLDQIPGIEAYSLRILMGGMLSNYLETTNIKSGGNQTGYGVQRYSPTAGTDKKRGILKKRRHTHPGSGCQGL